MYLFFDHNGTLLETVSTTALRQNNIGVNKIYVYIQDEERPDSGKISESITGLTHRYKKMDGEIVNGTSVSRPDDSEPYQDGIFEKKQLPFNKKRDLKHFVYGRDYDFFVLEIPSGKIHEAVEEIEEGVFQSINLTESTVFNVAGTVLATISATYSDEDILSLERITFTVESNGNISDAPISASQFLWLLSEIISIDRKVQNIRNLLIAKTSKEFSDLLISANVGKVISYNSDLYVVVRENNSIIAKEIANIADVNLIDTWVDTDFEDVEYRDNLGILWSSHYELSNGNKVYGRGDIAQCVPIVEGKNVSIKAEGKTFKINADSATQLYETAEDIQVDKAPEEIDPETPYGTHVEYMYEGQRFPEVGDLVIFKCDIPNSKGQNLILCKITSSEDFDDPKPYVYMRAICFLQGASGASEIILNGTKNEKPSFYAPTSGGIADGVNILVANGNGNEPVWKKLSLSQSGQQIALTLGGVEIGSFAPGNEYEAGDGLELKDKKFSLKIKGDYLYIDPLYGLCIREQNVADLAKIRVNGVDSVTKDVGIYAPTQSRVANSTQECYVLMPNGTNAEPIWGKLTIDNEPQADGFNTVFRLNGIEIGSVKHTQEIYLDNVERQGNKIIFSYNTASGRKQVEIDLADLVDVYEAGNGLARNGNTFSVKIEPNSTDFLEATENGIVFKKSALPEAGDKLEALQDAELNLASATPEIGVINENGIHTRIPEIELELQDGRIISFAGRNALPITAGENIEFKKNPNNTVSINAKPQTFDVADKGKFLVVGEDGSIVAESMTIGGNMLI